MKKILYIVSVSITSFAYSQIAMPVEANVSKINFKSNAFIDASTFYDPINSADNNVGKGLVFPQVDLTTFEFDLTNPKKRTLPTFYDGMIVYNTGKGQTVAEVSKGGVQVSVDKGFYYFFNPDGRANKNIDEGKWVKIADPKGFWSLEGNSGTTEATITDGTNVISAGNFIGTTDEKSLTIATNNVARLTIGKEGGLINESVGGTPFDFVLKVYGKAKFDGGIVTKSSTYPDYVFDNYFTGKSDVNPNYEFKKLNEVEQFIKENNHLPGVTKIDDLTKTENGYEVDNTQLSVQTLEKVEELYLHVIEQQKEIQALKAEIAELKK